MQEKRKMYNLVEEPRGNTYRAMLMFAQKICPYFLLVERPEIDTNSEGRAVLQSLGRFLIEQTETREWPGTVLLRDDMATVSIFEFSLEAMRILLDTTDSLYEWRLPSRPSDLCLLRPDRSAWLTTISHDGDAYLKITENEKSELVSKIPELEALLEED
jgi:hypothetical protein